MFWDNRGDDSLYGLHTYESMLNLKYLTPSAFQRIRHRRDGLYTIILQANKCLNFKSHDRQMIDLFS